MTKEEEIDTLALTFNKGYDQKPLDGFYGNKEEVQLNDTSMAH